jgi:NitT/TauT family transport system permease protein
MRAASARVRARRRAIIAGRIVVAVLFLGGWQGAVSIGVLDPFFVGSPVGITRQLIAWLVDGTSQGPLWQQVWVTLEETMAGFALGAVGGVVCGVILGRNHLLADIFDLYIKIANSIPRVVLGSLFVIAFGLGMGSKIALAFVMVFFVVFGNAFQGVREADRAMIANARILGASPLQVTLTVVLPSAMTWIIASLHISFGFGLIGAVVGEFLGARQGLGLLIATAQGSFNANGVFAAMVVLAVLALAVDYAIGALERRMVAWRPVPNIDSAA